MIPPVIRENLSNNKYMQTCKYCDLKGIKETKVEWHHALKYAGRSMQEEYSIIPLCSEHHRGALGTIHSDVKTYSEYLAISRGINELTKKYPKVNWQQQLNYLKTLYE